MSDRANVILKPRRAMPFFHRHPWVFAGAIARVQGDPQPGDEVALRANTGEYIGTGLFNPNSNIRVRLYAFDESATLDEAFWSARFDSAIALRQALYGRISGEDFACRLVYSEGDGLSGLVVDRYGDWLLVQLTSLALAVRQEMLLRLLEQKLQPAGIWLRTEKGIRESEGLELSDSLVAGREPPRQLTINEDGLRYSVDVVQGQKTGLYLDQRDNRAAVARYAAGRRVLDLFCYGGAFSITALARGGAREALGIDSSEPALETARANAELNGVGDRVRFEADDAFKALERLAAAGEKFDLVILDPPKMTRHRAGIDQALRGYHSLNRLAVDLLPPGGLLVTCSCSGLINREDFAAMLGDVALRANRPLQILESRSQSPDHPVSAHCLEGEYLKCFICRVG